MKILAMFVFLFSVNVHAKGGHYVEGQLLSVTHLCPIGVTCITDGTILTFEFELPNVCYELQPLKYKYYDVVPLIYPPVNTLVAIKAIAKNTAKPGEACAEVIKVETAQLSLPMIFPPFDYRFRGFKNKETVEDFN